MSTVLMPATPAPAQIDWKLKQPTQVNRSEWTGRRKATILPAAPYWTAQVAFPTIIGERAFLPWRSFLTKTQGQANSFRLIAVENVQITGVAPLVAGAGQGGTALATKGWGAAGVKLLDGMFVTINGQLLQLGADVVADGSGAATIQFLPYVRFTLDDNTPIEVSSPYALMCMSQDDNGWTVGRGQQYSVAFACEEAR